MAPIHGQNDHPDHLPGLNTDAQEFGKWYPLVMIENNLWRALSKNTQLIEMKKE